MFPGCVQSGVFLDKFSTRTQRTCETKMIQAIHPIYCILHLSDMKLGGMDKMKYYVSQTDGLLEDGMRILMKKWSDPRMPTMDFSSCHLSKQDKDF